MIENLMLFHPCLRLIPACDKAKRLPDSVGSWRSGDRIGRRRTPRGGRAVGVGLLLSFVFQMMVPS